MLLGELNAHRLQSEPCYEGNKKMVDFPPILQLWLLQRHNEFLCRISPQHTVLSAILGYKGTSRPTALLVMLHTRNPRQPKLGP